jgi:short-subunit dehydrogenase
MDWYLSKKVIITGGSSGIGKAAAILCAKFGAHVCILSRDESRCKAALGEIQQNGTRRYFTAPWMFQKGNRSRKTRRKS